jgi:PAS domain S-box-containing protein
LFREKERAQVTLNSIGDGVITTDVTGHIDYLNPVAEELTGWSNAQASGQPLSDVFQVKDENTHKPLPDPVQRCLNEQRSIHFPDNALWRTLRLSGLLNRNHRRSATMHEIMGAVLVLHDVTTLRNIQQMAWQARHDPLTGLVIAASSRCVWNRRSRAPAALRQQHSPHLDLDRQDRE